jgi:hypothetical protein
MTTTATAGPMAMAVDMMMVVTKMGSTVVWRGGGGWRGGGHGHWVEVLSAGPAWPDRDPKVPLSLCVLGLGLRARFVSY